MKQIIKKMLVAVCTISMIGTLFVGCGSKEDTATTTSTPTETKESSSSTQTDSATATEVAEPVTLTLLIDKDAQLDALNALIAAIETKYNIKTEIELRPGGSDGDNVVKTRIATGDMTDLIAYNSGSLLQALDPTSNFVDLTNEPFMANLDDSFKSTVTVNGKIFGVPNGSTTGGAWLYNKKVYAELGLIVPKTWDELMSNCEKIKAAGIVPIAASYKDSWTSQLILLADNYNLLQGAPTFADDFTNNVAKYATTPSALRGFEKLQEVFTKGYLNEDYLATTYDVALKMLAEGTAAQYPMLTFALPTIEANYPETINDIGAFAQPGDTADANGLTIWLPGAIYVNNQSEKIEACKTWVAFMASVEGTEIMAAAQKAQGPYAVKGVTLPEDSYVAVQEMMQYFESGKTAPALEFMSPLKGPNLPQITVECGSAIKTPEECAAEYDKDVEKQAKQLGLSGW